MRFNRKFAAYLLSRTDLDMLVVPLLQMLCVRCPREPLRRLECVELPLVRVRACAHACVPAVVSRRCARADS
jgi:hypothetical protein